MIAHVTYRASRRPASSDARTIGLSTRRRLRPPRGDVSSTRVLLRSPTRRSADDPREPDSAVSKDRRANRYRCCRLEGKTKGHQSCRKISSGPYGRGSAVGILMSPDPRPPPPPLLLDGRLRPRLSEPRPPPSHPVRDAVRFTGTTHNATLHRTRRVFPGDRASFVRFNRRGKHGKLHVTSSPFGVDRSRSTARRHIERNASTYA